MYGQVTRRSWWSVFSLALICVFVLSFAAACGDDEEDDEAGTAGEATPTETRPAAAAQPTATEEEAADADETEEATPGAGVTGIDIDLAQLEVVSECIEENTDAEMINDLQAGETETAEAVYRECLEQELPESLTSLAEPIVEQAGECGTQVTEDLTDEEVERIEQGDEQLIEQVTNETLACIAQELGV